MQTFKIFMKVVASSWYDKKRNTKIVEEIFWMIVYPVFVGVRTYEYHAFHHSGGLWKVQNGFLISTKKVV